MRSSAIWMRKSARKIERFLKQTATTTKQIEILQINNSMNQIKMHSIPSITYRFNLAGKKILEMKSKLMAFYIQTSIKKKQIWPQHPRTLGYNPKSKPKNSQESRRN